MKKKDNKNVCHNISILASNRLRGSFYRLGFFIASRPWQTILVSLLFVGLCCVGLLNFRTEKNAVKLWIPTESKFLVDTKWLMETFQQMYRPQTVLLTAPDVLQPEVLKNLYYIDSEIKKAKGTLTNESIEWNEICFKIPFISSILRGQQKTETTETTSSRRQFNPSVDLYSGFYCPLIDLLPLGCFQPNILELWNFNEKTIEMLTKEDILEALHTITISPTTGHETNFVNLLGGIKRNSSGHIVSASSLMSHWMVFVNVSGVDQLGNEAGTEDFASAEALSWEAAFISEMEILHEELNGKNEIEIFYTAGRSFGDISSSTMFQDMNKLLGGAILMFIYVQLILSKFSWTEFRILLGTMGLLSIGLAFIAAIGVCAALNIFYGPVHTALPFLLMGLGVDDIFVLMAIWRKVETTHNSKSIAERMALTLKHGGASITITSVTDVASFLVAATTVLPSLRSFCIHCAIGIMLTYGLAVTFVVAVFVLDQRRVNQSKNACIPCIVHKKTDIRFDLNLMQRFLHFLYTKIIFTKAGKLIVIASAMCFFGLSLESLLRIEQKFDPLWLVPEQAYLYKYQIKQSEFYPDMGSEGSIFFGRLNYTNDLPKILSLIDELDNRKDVVHRLNAWPKPFHDFVSTYYDKNIKNETLQDSEWRFYLSKFLFSHQGGKYQPMFKFDGKLQCGHPTPNVTASALEFQYRIFTERKDYLNAMHSMDDLVDEMNFSDFATVWAKIYGHWITNEVIDREILRNISLALVCVMSCTFLIIMDIRTCFFIFVSVLLTLVNVGGFLQRWGQTIDLVTCVGLQLAVGLSVDYAAHIGHTFLTISNGSKEKRALETILHIGAAVIYGGGSTLLALSLLANSEAYTFKSFFKIFVLMITFGLFNGIVLLPVVLSLVGSDSLNKDDKNEQENKNEENVGAEMISFVCTKSQNNSNDVTNPENVQLMTDPLKSKKIIEQNEKS